VRIPGGAYHVRGHKSLKVSEKGWFWWTQGTGSDNALDYLVKVKGMGLPEAAEYVLSLTGHAPAGRIPDEERRTKKRSKLLLPEKHGDADAVRDYLLRRGIDEGFVDGLISSGRIYETHFHDKKSGRTFPNAVFVGMDTDGKPRQASVRGIDSRFKVEASGSDKRFSFSIEANEPSDTVRLFEGAIDLLSFMTLCKMNYVNPRAQHLLCLSGVYMPQSDPKRSKVPVAFTQYTQDHGGITKVILHLDNDRTGRASAEALALVLPEAGYEVKDRPPKCGGDYNDYLLETIRTKQMTDRPDRER
jgi:hypothetical protein